MVARVRAAARRPECRADGGAGLVETVRRELEREGYVAVVPGSDAALRAFSRHRGQLEPLARLGLPAEGATERAFDKLLLLEEADATGSPARPAASAHRPPSCGLRAEVGYPLMLKPARSVRTDGAWRQQQSVIVRDLATSPRPRDAGRALDAAALPRGCARRLRRGRDRRRELLGRAVARYARTWPPKAGSASASATIVPPEDLVERSRRPARTGSGGGDFESDSSSSAEGRYATIDLNPRVYGSLSLAISAGANLPAIWVGLLQGERRPPIVARAGLHYRWEEGEVPALLRAVVDGRSDELMAVVRPQRHTAWAFTRALDPGPLLARSIALGRLRGVPAVRRFSRLVHA